MKTNEISRIVIGKAIEIHRTLRPGLLESAYQQCLHFELTQAGLSVKREVALPLIYKELELDHGYRIDLLVNDQIVVETKCVEALLPVQTAQVLTYMKLGEYQLGLLINFHVDLLKNGIKRFIL